jgi:hypothetical protein
MESTSPSKKLPNSSIAPTIAAIAPWKEVLFDVAASIIGSAACVYAGQPFDTIKVRLQVNPTKYTGLVICFRQTIAEGVSSLWRGSVPAFIGALSENAVAFATSGLLKRLLHNAGMEHDNKPLYMPFLTGGITGMFSAIVLCPCDVLKCRAQVNISKVSEPILHLIYTA